MIVDGVPTVPPFHAGCNHGSVGLWLRRVAVLTLASLVVVSLLGLLGVQTGEVTAERNGYRLTLRYPEVARAGLDTPYEITVVREAGLGKELELAVTEATSTCSRRRPFTPSRQRRRVTETRCT